MRRVAPLPQKPIANPELSGDPFRDKDVVHPLLGSLFGIYKNVIVQDPGPISNPLTYHEMKLQEQILNPRNQLYLYSAVHRTLGPYGVSSRDSEDLVTSHLDRAFFSYIEKEFPLRNSDFERFAQYMLEYVVDKFNQQQSFQHEYDKNRYSRTKDPRGMVYSSYPEVI